LIAVANGQGVIDAFKSLQANYIITGGQTMNPATEDFVAMIEKANAENIIILPNNSNIVMTATQAAAAFDDSNIEVLRTNSIAEGLSACIVFDQNLTIKENMENMIDARDRTLSGAVTYAIKDTKINGLKIKAKENMGILGKDIVVSGNDKIEVAQKLLEKLVSENTGILTVITGEDVNEQESDCLEAFIKDRLKVEYELIRGLQPVYSFLFGAE